MMTDWRRTLVAGSLLLLLYGCEADIPAPADTTIADIPPVSSVETTMVSVPQETTVPSPPETTIAPPPETTRPGVLSYGADLRTYDNVREMKAVLLADPEGDGALMDAHALRELSGLPPEYTEFLIEWAGTSGYTINYSAGEAVVVFYPYDTEEDLHRSMEATHQRSGTYEALLANPLLSHVTKTDVPTEYGSRYECQYDTSKITGLTLVYQTYADAETGRDYVLTEDIYPQGITRHLYVFDGENSFFCLGQSDVLTIPAAFALKSIFVE